MARPRPAVEVETSFRQVASDATTAISMRVTLCYFVEDPYAVQMLFYGEGPEGEIIPWTCARELFMVGLDEPAGIGDVRVWPWHTPRGDFVALALSSPDGNVLFEVPRHVLVRFLRRTYVLVPRGRESDYLSFDDELERLLTDN